MLFAFILFLPLLYTKRGSSHPTDRVQTDPPTVNEDIERLEALYVTRTPAETFVRSHGGEKVFRRAADKNRTLRLEHKHVDLNLSV